MNNTAPHREAKVVRVLPRHVETEDTFSVLSDLDSLNYVEEWIFRISRSAIGNEPRRLKIERIEVRVLRGSTWQDRGTSEVDEAEMPVEVLQRAADKLARKTAGRGR